MLDDGHGLPFPAGLLINGRANNESSFTVDQGKCIVFTVFACLFLYVLVNLRSYNLYLWGRQDLQVQAIKCRTYHLNQFQNTGTQDAFG